MGLPKLLLRLAGSAVMIFVGWSVGCSEKATPCSPGDYVPCDCGSDPAGVSQCTKTGEGYGTCDCSGTVAAKLRDALDASTQAAPDAEAREAGSLIPFMGPCEKDEQCTTGLCFSFNAKGPHCSKPCTGAGDCEAPSTGCSGMSVCKVP